MLLTVLLPTYNEVDNIGPMVRDLRAALDGVEHEILVVDDASPDGTADAARRAGARVIVRQERGLATAVVEGLRQARGTYVLTMDADGQHPVEVVPRMLAAAEDGAQLVLGSRYAAGGSEGGFALHRRMVSSGAGLLARLALPPVRRHSVTDPMTGLFLVRRDCVPVDDLRPSGYKILLEILGRSDIQRVDEVGYTFGSRMAGQSKLGGQVIIQYLSHLAALAMWHPENRRLATFAAVGLSGIVVNLGLLFLLHGVWGLTDLLAVPLAIEASIITNFLLNDRLTFGDRREGHLLQRLAKFNTVSLLALIINTATFIVLARGFHLHYLAAEAVAIFVAFGANYAGNMNWTYGGEDRFRLSKALADARHWLPLAIVVLAAAATYGTNLDHRPSIYFDEGYYVPVGYQFSQQQWFDPAWENTELGPRPWNWEHPPLAKFMIGAVVSMTSNVDAFEGERKDSNDDYVRFLEDLETEGTYGWRGLSAAMGVVTVLGVGLAAARLFGGQAGTIAGALVLLENMVLVHARTAILDIYAAGFVALALAAATVPRKRGILVAAVFLGLGFASKYTVIFAGPAVLALVIYCQWRAGNLSKSRLHATNAAVVLTPLLFWFAAHLPFLLGWASRFGWSGAFARLGHVTREAILWGQGAAFHHEYHTTPAAWLLMHRPTWYDVGWSSAGKHLFIYAVGNPIVWWLGSFAILAAAPVFALRPALRSNRGAFLVVAALPLSVYAGFFLLSRSTFLYYVTLLVPFFALAGAAALILAFRGPIWSKLGAAGVSLLVVAGFVWYLPVTYGIPITMEHWDAIFGLLNMDACPDEPTGRFRQVC